MDDSDLEIPSGGRRGNRASSYGALLGCVLAILVVAFGDWRQLALAACLCAVTVGLVLIVHRVSYVLEAKRERELQIMRRLEIDAQARRSV